MHTYKTNNKVILIFIAFVYFSIQQARSCENGCKKCVVNSSNGANVCQECEQDYLLDNKQNLCVYQKCLKYTYFEIQSNTSQGKCVPICNELNAPNTSQNTCNEANFCSIQYVQQSSTTKGRNIQSIYASNSINEVFLVYDQFVNSIDQQSGSFERSYTFDSSIFSVQQYKDKLFLFGNNKNSVFQWNPRDNTVNKLLEISQGTLKASSQIMEVDNNSNIFLVTSVDDINKSLLFTQFNTFSYIDSPPPQFKISFADNSVIFLSEKLIIQQATNWQIFISKVVQNSDKTLSLVTITPSYICTNAQGSLQYVQRNNQDNTILIQFASTGGIYQITSDGMHCNKVFLDDNPLKLSQIDLLINNNSVKLVLVSLSGGIFKGFDYQNQKEVFSLKADSIKDFQGIIVQTNVNTSRMKIYILNQKDIIESFTIQITTVANQNLFSTVVQQNSQISSYIQNPSKLMLANKFTDSNGTIQSIDKIFLVYQSAQIINIGDSNTIGIAQDFQDKLFQNEKKINKIIYSNTAQLIVSCGDDGKVIVWQAVDLNQPVFFYQYSRVGQKCIDVRLFQLNSMAIQFESEVAIINIYNQLDSYSYPVDKLVYTQLFVEQNYLFILTGNNLFVLKQKEKIYYNGNILPSNLTVKFTKFYVNSNLEIIVIDSTFKISLYQFIDSTSIVLQVHPTVPAYQSNYPITNSFFMKKQDSTKDDLLVLNDSNKQMIILDMNFIEKVVKQYNFASLQRMYAVENTYFFFIVKVYDITSVYQYGSVCFDYSTNEFIYIGTNLVVLDITQVYKRTEADGTINFSIWLVNPIGYTSYTLELQWNRNTKKIMYDKFYYTPGNNQVACYGDLSTNFIAVGSQTGEARVLVFSKGKTPEKVYTSTQVSDDIQIVQRNFKIGQFFIATSYQIKCFNIHTNKLIETITFQTLPSPPALPSIKNLAISHSLNVLVAYISTEIIVKNFITNKLYSALLKSDSGIYLTLINGVYFDEINQLIYVYGSDIVTTDANMSKVSALTQLGSNNQYNQCIFTPTAAYCSMNTSFIHIFDRTQSFYILSIVTVQPALKGFQFILDQEYQQIIVYKQLIDLYNVQGVFIQTINAITAPIMQLEQAGQCIMVFTTGSGFIFSRGSFTLKGNIQPAGGTIQKAFYIAYVNQIAFFTDEIRYGQVLFYNLDTQQSAGTISNTFQENKIGRVVQVSFDNDSVMLNYIDYYGNFQNVIFSTSKTTDNVICIKDMQLQLVSYPMGYLLDFDQNSVYVYASNALYKHNYNLLTRPMHRIIKKQQSLQIIFDQQVNGKTQPTLFFVDYWNNFYMYQNYHVTFKTRYDDEVLEILTYNQNNSQMVLVFFLNYILAFKDTYNFVASSAYLKNTNYHYRKLLLNSNGRIVFNTVSNEIVEFDFLNNQEIALTTLDVSDIILCTQIVGDATKEKWYLLVGTKLGNIIQYDLVNKISKVFNSFGVSPVVQIININLTQSNLAIVKDSGEIFQVDSSTFIQTQNQSILSNRQKQSQDGDNANFGVAILQVDITFNRYYINLQHETYLGVYNLEDHSFIKYLSFPDDEYKQMLQNDSFIILSSSAQINVYNNNLEFINRLRRYNRKDRISDIKLIDSNKLVIVFTSRIESVLIDAVKKTVTAVDVVALNDSRLVLVKLLQTEKVVLLIGISKTNIFEKRVSLGLFDTLGATSLANPNNYCASTLIYLDNSQIQNQFDYVMSTSVANMNFVLSILVSNEIRPMYFLQKSTAKVIIRPIDKNSNILNLNSQSLLLLPFNVFLENFNFQFSQENSEIKFNQLSQNITLKDIIISNHDIPSQTSLIFDSKQVVLIQNLSIENINFNIQKSTSTGRRLSQASQSQSAFLQMNNCTTILIQNLILNNVNLKDPDQQLLSIFNSKSVIIENISIQNCQFAGTPFLLQQIKSITIQSVSISNCKGIQSNQNIQQINGNSQSTKSESFFLFNFVGVIYLSISGYEAQNNQELSQIQTSRQYQQPEGILTLSTDILIMTDINLDSNTFPESFSFNEQKYLFYLESSNITVVNLQQSKNQGNCMISTSSIVIIKDSSFDLNQGVIGASLHLSSIESSVLIQNSKFLNNKAHGTGGAIMVNNVNQFQIDEKSVIQNNQAEIGGGIRIISNQQKTNAYQDLTEIIKCTFQSNVGQIYGNNIGRYPSQIQIQIKNENSENTLLNKQKIQTFVSAEKVTINSLQSGGLFPINLMILDDDNNRFKIDLQKLKSNNYPQFILDELSQYQIEVTELSTVKQSSASSSTAANQQLQDVIADIKGESLVTARQFDQFIDSFVFTTLSLTYIPKQSTDSIIIKFTMNNHFDPMIIPLSLSFRECLKGEIPINSSSKIITCQECSIGTYSLVDPNQALSSQKDVDIQCKKCPSFATSCSKDQIVLESGYWRLNQDSDLILPCNSDSPNICNEADKFSKYGCIKGYIGPLCETCDIQGKVWEGERYTNSFSQFSCNKCSEQAYQVFFITLSILAVIIYLLFSIIMFMNSYIYNSTCCYLRLMSILPLSKSSIKDESTFFIKALVNYMQLSSVLFQFSFSFLPQIFAVIPSLAGQPVSRIIVSSTCLYSQKDLENYGEEKLRTIVQSTFPFFFLLICYFFLSIFSKIHLLNVGKYHKYIMINFLFLFFQPDSISFFTQALSCREIGGRKYNQINLLLDCKDQTYQKFMYTVIIPNLLFWIFFPLVIFYYMMKYHHKKNNLHYCTTKYKFGYFYLEFKREYYFWEFVRIYYKLAIVITVTLFRQLELLMYILCIIFIFLYIFFVQKAEPFESKILLKLEVLSYFILIFNVLFSQLDSQYPHIIFKLGVALMHYGFIFFIILIIAKFKLNTQNSAVSKVLHVIAKKILPNKLFIKVTKHRIRTLQPLKLWRKVFKNLTFLREQKATDQIKQIESLHKSKIQQQKLQLSKMFNSIDCKQGRGTNPSICIKYKQDESTANEFTSERFKLQDIIRESSFSKCQNQLNCENNNISPLESSNRMMTDRNFSQFKVSNRKSDDYHDQILDKQIQTVTQNLVILNPKQEDLTFTKIHNSIDESEDSRNMDSIEFEEDKKEQEINNTKPIQLFQISDLLYKNKNLSKETDKDKIK